MADSFEVTTTADRPIEEVFAFLADGENDPKFSSRVLEMRKATDGPIGVGTRFQSTVKDAGFKTKREFEITEFLGRLIVGPALKSARKGADAFGQAIKKAVESS